MSNTAPLGYKRVEYLESTGTQYIDTNYIPVQGDNLEFKNVSINQENFGALFSAGTGNYQLILIMNLEHFSYFKYFAADIVTNFYNNTLNNETIKIQNGKIYINDILKSTSNYEGEVNTSLNIFRRANNTSYINAKMGEIIITNNNTLVRDYIPVLNENNEAGLYDLVNKEFYGNSGTGSFQYGNIIPEGTIAEKFNYSLEAKELIKDGINYLGGNVTDETTLKEYRDELDSVYAKLPKVTNSTASSSVTLNPTLKGRIDSTLKGQTGQDTTDGNQLIDFSIMTNTSGVTSNFSNDILTVSSTTIYATAYKNITNIYKANAGKTISFYYDDFSTLESSFKIDLTIDYNDGTQSSTRLIKNSDSENNSVEIPSDTSNIRYVFFRIMPITANNVTENTVIITKPLLQVGTAKKDYEPYTAGASPNPNYEQKVKCVTGENTVKVHGKNRIPNNGTTTEINGIQWTVNDDKSITISGTSTAPSDFYLYGSRNDTGKYFNIEKGEYVISGYATNVLMLGREKDIGLLNSYVTIINTLARQDCNLYGLFLRIESGKTVNTTVYPMLVEGDTLGDYEPYYEPQEKELDLESYNKINYDNNTNILQANLSGSTNISNSSPSNRTLYMRCKPNTTYTIQKPVGTFFAVGTTVQTPALGGVYYQRIQNNNADSITITTNEFAKYLLVWFWCTSDSLTENQTLNLIQIVEGSTEKPYQEYYHYEVYEDGYFSYENNKWYLNNVWGKDTLNGTENWYSSSAINNHYRYSLAYSNGYSGTDAVNILCYSNIFKGVSRKDLANVNEISVIDYINVLIDDITSVSEFKTYLSNHNAIIYYKLATPSKTEITNQTLINQLEEIYKLMSYDGTTIIETECEEGNMPIIISASALKGE